MDIERRPCTCSRLWDSAFENLPCMYGVLVHDCFACRHILEVLDAFILPRFNVV